MMCAYVWLSEALMASSMPRLGRMSCALCAHEHRVETQRSVVIFEIPYNGY